MLAAISRAFSIDLFLLEVCEFFKIRRASSTVASCFLLGPCFSKKFFKLEAFKLRSVSELLLFFITVDSSSFIRSFMMFISGTIPFFVMSAPAGVKYLDVVSRTPEPSLIRKMVCTEPLP